MVFFTMGKWLFVNVFGNIGNQTFVASHQCKALMFVYPNVDRLIQHDV
jgi:hypothetical protein